MKRFKKICTKTQKELKGFLANELEKYYPTVINLNGFLFVKGSDILLTAHMDTVHKQQVRKKDIKTYTKKNKHYITSPKGIGGDDRCGIWIITELLRKTKFRPTILFCEDEEVGGIGSNKFIVTEFVDQLLDMKYLIELDRANETDAVFYNCGNKDFQKYICNQTGYKTAYGSFSDISHLSPAVDIASVNLSCGYYKAHTTDEYVCMEEMETTLAMVIKLLTDEPNIEQFDYQEKKFNYGYYGYYGGYGGYGNYYNSNRSGNYYGHSDYGKAYKNYDKYEIGYDDGYDDGYDEGYMEGMKKRPQTQTNTSKVYGIEFIENNENKKYFVFAQSKFEAIGMFVEIYNELTYRDIVSVWSEQQEQEQEQLYGATEDVPCAD